MLTHFYKPWERISTVDTNLYDKTYMTHIIAGKLKGETFLKSDCIVYKGEHKYFKNKVIKLLSIDNTFISCCGSELFSTALQYLDTQLTYENKKIDIYSHSLIDDIVNIYYKLSNKVINKGRIFIINSEDVIYFDITIKSEDDYDFKRTIIKDGYFITSNINNNELPINLNKEHTINTFYEYHKLGVDFKDRFTNIEFKDNLLKIDTPYKNINDIKFEYFGGYKGFMWEDLN